MAETDGILGLDPRSLQEIYAQRIGEARQRTQKSIDAIGFSTAGERAAAQAGGNLALALGQRFAPDQVLTAQDKQAIAIKDRTNALFTQKLRDDPSMSDEDKGLAMQMAAAEAYRENGVYDKYNQLVLDTAHKKRTRAQAESQQRLLDAEVHDINNKQVMSDINMQKAVAGQSLDFFLPGEDPLTAEPKAGKMMSDGTLEYRDNKGGTKYFTDFVNADTAIHLANLRRENAATGLTHAIKPEQVWDATERRGYREATNGAIIQSRTVGKITDSLADLMNRGQNPNEVLGVPGKALGVINNIVSGLKSVSDYTGQLIDGNGNVKFSGGINDKSFMTQMSADPVIKAAIDGIQVPDSIKGSKEADVYRGQMVQLAYAVWRSMEGQGARNASNQDFANALTRIGGSSGNINSLFASLSDVMKSGTDNLELTYNGARQQGRDFLGWDEGKVDTFLFNGQFKKAKTEVQMRRSRMNVLLGGAPIGVSPERWNILNADEKKQYLETLRVKDDE